MTDKDLEIAKYALQEIKDQYKTYLESYDNIKKKNQILLLICSLIITLPLSETIIVKNIILAPKIIIALFISGTICLVSAIILLIVSMKEPTIKTPLFEDIIGSIGKYKASLIFKNAGTVYSKNLNKNISKRDQKRRIIQIAEKFIIFGIILTTGTITYILITGATL